MFSYERLETYGDSFLKFAVSLVLFDAFESENEGALTQIKMKLVGNRNLLYVGNNLKIGSYLSVFNYLLLCIYYELKFKYKMFKIINLGQYF